MARHPNQVSPYGPMRSNAKGAKNPEYAIRKETQERDLKALEELQQRRPAKPPGKR